MKKFMRRGRKSGRLDRSTKSDKQKGDKQKERQTERATNRKKDKQRERQTERKTNRKSDKQKERQTERATNRKSDKQKERQTERETNRKRDTQKARQVTVRRISRYSDERTYDRPWFRDKERNRIRSSSRVSSHKVLLVRL